MDLALSTQYVKEAEEGEQCAAPGESGLVARISYFAGPMRPGRAEDAARRQALALRGSGRRQPGCADNAALLATKGGSVLWVELGSG